jgi:hypothetical protein
MRDIIRIARLTSLLLVLLLEARTSAGASFPLQSAPLRTPQAVVHGTGLQDYFAGVGESIAPSTDQRDVGLLTMSASNNSTFTIQVELDRNPDGLVVGIYNGYDANPTLMPVFPARATLGWFAVISFRTAPVRAVVNLFDDGAAFLGSTTYLGVDRRGMGFYVQGPGGTFYSQDARNPNGAPQLLFFAGTGVNTGSAWQAVEDQPVAGGADGDYDDLIMFFESVCSCTSFGLTPVQQSSWGRLKSIFR